MKTKTLVWTVCIVFLLSIQTGVAEGQPSCDIHLSSVHQDVRAGSTVTVAGTYCTNHDFRNATWVAFFAPQFVVDCQLATAWFPMNGPANLTAGTTANFSAELRPDSDLVGSHNLGIGWNGSSDSGGFWKNATCREMAFDAGSVTVLPAIAPKTPAPAAGTVLVALAALAVLQRK